MRQINSLADIQIVLRELLDWKARVENGQLDFKMNRIRNVGPGVDPDDVVTVRQLPAPPKG